MNNVLNGDYPKNILNKRFYNADEAVPTCQDGYVWDGLQCVLDTVVTPDSGVCTSISGTPCDVAFTIEPNPYPCTSYNGFVDNSYTNYSGEKKYRNAGEVVAISAALAGIGSAIGSIFGAKAAKQEEINAAIETENELALQAEKRTTILYIIIGVVGLVAIGVGAYTVVRYVKKWK